MTSCDVSTVPPPVEVGLLEGAMSRQQVAALAIVVALNALDGLDLLVVSFAAASIAREWGLNPSALGVIIASGMIGMVAGSILISPLADRFGRRPIVLICLAIMTLGTFGTGLAWSPRSLALFRLVTGLGVGALLPTLNALAAEHASGPWKIRAAGLLTAGYPVGGILGGLLAAALLTDGNWRMIFHVAGTASAIMLALAWAALPESVPFLAQRTKPEALPRLNRGLTALGRPGVRAMPAGLSTAAVRRPASLVLRPPLRRGTSVLLSSYMLHTLSFYFVLGWLPKVLSDAGMSPSSAASTAVLLNVGGVVGGAGFGWIGARLGPPAALRGLLLASAALAACFPLLLDETAALRAVIAAIGACGVGAVAGFYALLGGFYPAGLRSTGTGLVLGIGRGGAALGPLAGGMLLSLGLDGGSAVALIGMASAAAALVLLLLRADPPGAQTPERDPRLLEAVGDPRRTAAINRKGMSWH